MSDSFEGHTPGPWRSMGCNIYPANEVDGVACICSVRQIVAGDPDYDPNTRLIAAAPDLLAERDRLLWRISIIRKCLDTSARGEQIRIQTDAHTVWAFGPDELESAIKIALGLEPVVEPPPLTPDLFDEAADIVRASAEIAEGSS